MKSYVLAMVMVLVGMTTAFGQGSERIQTLFGGDDVRLTGWGGPEVRLGQFNESAAIFAGAKGGLLINSMLTIGLGGYGVVTSHKIDDVFGPDTNAYLRMGYGGLVLVYTDSPNELIHFTANTLIGFGGASYTSSYSDFWEDHDNDNKNTYASSGFFVWEIGAGVEFNLTKWMRAELGGEYRLISGLDLAKRTNSDIAGFSGHLLFKFGSF